MVDYLIQNIEGDNMSTHEHMPKNYTTFENVEILKETDGAALFKIDDKEIWLPLS